MSVPVPRAAWAPRPAAGALPACDCHMHVYDARYPADPQARYTPPDALVPAYQAVQGALGLKRCVVVTPSTYGQDNRITVEALRALNAGGTAARGVAVLDARVDEATLAGLHAAGVRAVRFNQTLGCTSLDDLEPLAERIAARGWHVELLLPPAVWPEVAGRLRALPVPLVLDHFGRLPWPARQHAGHRAILGLLEAGNTWVKLSGAYLHQGVAPADWAADAQALVTDYLQAAPHRLVWGSNWPHPSASAGVHAAPTDAELLALLRRWVGDDALCNRILADNPAALYDF